MAQYRDVPDPDLTTRVAASTGLSPAVAARVVDDVIAYYNESVEQYVRRRHAEMQLYGGRNPEIFAALTHELDTRVFAAPPLTERQLRRIVYG